MEAFFSVEVPPSDSSHLYQVDKKLSNIPCMKFLKNKYKSKCKNS